MAQLELRDKRERILGEIKSLIEQEYDLKVLGLGSSMRGVDTGNYDGGRIKTVDIVTKDSDSYIGRYYAEPDERIHAFARFLGDLKGGSMSVVEPIPTRNGEAVARTENGAALMVFPQEHELGGGTSQYQRTITPGKLGCGLGRFHKEISRWNEPIPSSLEARSPSMDLLLDDGWHNLQMDRLGRISSDKARHRSGCRVISAARDALLADIFQLYVDREEETDVPVALRDDSPSVPLFWIHGKWTRRNIVATEGAIRTTTLDYMRRDVREVDLALAIHSFFYTSGSFDPERGVVPFLMGYSEHAPRVNPELVTSWVAIHAVHLMTSLRSKWEAKRVWRILEWASERLL